jgi:hypothetical protein
VLSVVEILPQRTQREKHKVTQSFIAQLFYVPAGSLGEDPEHGGKFDHYITSQPVNAIFAASLLIISGYLISPGNILLLPAFVSDKI